MMSIDDAIEYFANMRAYNDEIARRYEPEFMRERMEQACEAASIAMTALIEKKRRDQMLSTGILELDTRRLSRGQRTDLIEEAMKTWTSATPLVHIEHPETPGKEE